MINHYETLGLPNYASSKEVRKAYLAKIRRYHPDVNKSPQAEEISKQINVAKEALETAEKKESYDRQLRWSLEYKSSPTITYPRKTQRTSSTRQNTDSISREERIRRNKARNKANRMKEYAQGLKIFPLPLRYVFWVLFCLVWLFVLYTVAFIDEETPWVFIGLFVVGFYYYGVSMFVNEFYKHHSFQSRTKPLTFNLDKVSGRIFHISFYTGSVLVVAFKYYVKYLAK